MVSRLTVKHVVNQVFDSVTYILPIGGTSDCIIVDCGDVEGIIESGWNVIGVLLTHSHFDHIYGLNKLLEVFPNAIVYTNCDGQEGLQNPKLNFSRYHDDVDDFVFCYPENIFVVEKECEIGMDYGLMVNVLFTPGHDPSCITYQINGMLFTGDAYIPGVKPVTIFPHSSKIVAIESEKRLKELESNGYFILPGHKI